MKRELKPKDIKKRYTKIKAVIALLDKGLNLTQACKNAQVGKRTLYDWASDEGWEWIKEDLKHATKTFVESSAESVERSMLQRAIGYTYEEEHRKSKEQSDGTFKMMIDKTVRKNRPADVTALIFVLCNLAREGLTSIDWQNVYDIKIDKTKLETLDDLMSKMFDSDGKKGKRRASQGTLPEFDADTSEALPGESEEQREIRESLSVEMQD